jgi:hypothetical protein
MKSKLKFHQLKSKLQLSKKKLTKHMQKSTQVLIIYMQFVYMMEVPKVDTILHLLGIIRKIDGSNLMTSGYQKLLSKRFLNNRKVVMDK